MMQFADATSYIINQFKGIREIDGLNGLNGQISATTAINVETQPIEDGSGYYLRTVLGNVKIGNINAPHPSLPQLGEGTSDYKIIKLFETEQDGVKYLIIYAENDTKGVLYKLDDGEFTLIADNLNVTGQANGITMNDTAYKIMFLNY